MTKGETPATSKARIYRPSASATQSGRASERHWILEYEPAQPRFSDALTGWTGSSDMRSQIRMRFDTLEQARNYAERRKINYHVSPPRDHGVKPKSYAENFSRARRQPWTH